eukprot:2807131-Prymnesium_polylepis.2
MKGLGPTKQQAAQCSNWLRDSPISVAWATLTTDVSPDLPWSRQHEAYWKLQCGGSYQAQLQCEKYPAAHSHEINRVLHREERPPPGRSRVMQAARTPAVAQRTH